MRWCFCFCCFICDWLIDFTMQKCTHTWPTMMVRIFIINWNNMLTTTSDNWLILGISSQTKRKALNNISFSSLRICLLMCYWTELNVVLAGNMRILLHMLSHHKCVKCLANVTLLPFIIPGLILRFHYVECVPQPESCGGEAVCVEGHLNVLRVPMWLSCWTDCCEGHAFTAEANLATPQ